MAGDLVMSISGTRYVPVPPSCRQDARGSTPVRTPMCRPATRANHVRFAYNPKETEKQLL